MNSGQVVHTRSQHARKKTLFVQHLMDSELLPQLRGEWVRKDVDKIGMGKSDRTQIPSQSERPMCVKASKCSRTCTSSVTAPVWGISTP
jgi:hypothetical protein